MAKIVAVFLPVILAILNVFLVYAESDNVKPFSHFSGDNCSVCHLSHGAKSLTKDPNSLCKGCHPSSHEKDHKVGIKTKLNRANLPLDSENRIVCAYTCHNMHPEKGSTFEKNLLRTAPDTLCLSCHEK